MADLSYKEFMTKVRNRLSKLSAPELEQIVLSWAANEHHSRRWDFLRALTPSNEGKVKEEEVAFILTELDDFARRIEDGEYCQGWGWDDAYGEERDWGDESWASEMDEFFAQAGLFLQAGDYANAEQVYQRLFDLLDQNWEPGHFPGDPMITTMLDVDLSEELALFLRTVYLGRTGAERPAITYSLMQDFKDYVDVINLQAVIEAAEEPLPDLEVFLAAWIELLQNEVGSLAEALLREAVQFQGGPAALREFARKKAACDPRAYFDLVLLLQQQGKQDEVLEVAKEALQLIPVDFTVRSKIARILAEEGQRRGDVHLELEGYEQSFFSAPSLPSLLDLYEASLNLRQFEAMREKVKNRLAALSTEGDYRCVSTQSSATQRAILHNLILSGNYEELFDLCSDRGSLGWSGGTNPRPLLVLFLMGLLSKEGLRRGIRDKMWRAVISETHLGADDNLVEKYEFVLQYVYKDKKISREEEERYLEWCHKEVNARVKAITDGKYRYSYGKAADLLVAWAETLINLGQSEEADRLVNSYHQQYSRYSALRKEIRRSWQESVELVHSGKD